MVEVKIGEHILLLGRTGSGKTHYATHNLIPQFKPCVIFDTKRVKGDLPYPSAAALKDVPKLLDKHGIARICPPKLRANRLTSLNQLCAWLLDVEGVNLYVDELAHVCGAGSIMPYHEEILVSGRGHRITHIGAVQRPVAILSPTITANTTHYWYFTLGQKDLEACKRDLPYLEEARDLRPWEWVYTDGLTAVKGGEVDGR